MERFGFEPGAKGHVSRDILPPPIALLFWRQRRLRQGYTGCTVDSWGQAPAWQLWWGQPRPWLHPTTQTAAPQLETTNIIWNSFPRTAAPPCRRDCMGMLWAMPSGWEELPTAMVPEHSWPQRMKLLFISPFWKWPNSSNIIYLKSSIQKQLSVFPRVQSLAQLQFERIPGTCSWWAKPMCVQLKIQQYFPQRKNTKSTKFLFSNKCKLHIPRKD